MAQGDMTLFDSVTEDIASGLFSLASVSVYIIDNTKVAEYDEIAPNLTRYTRARGDAGIVPALYFGITKDVEDEITSYYAKPVVFNVFPGCENAYQALLVNNFWGRSIAYVDLTPDGGETPWNLGKVPLRLTWGDDNLLFSVTVA